VEPDPYAEEMEACLQQRRQERLEESCTAETIEKQEKRKQEKKKEKTIQQQQPTPVPSVSQQQQTPIVLEKQPTPPSQPPCEHVRELKKKAPDTWTITDIDYIMNNLSAGELALPHYNELKHLNPATIKLDSEVDAFVDEKSDSMFLSSNEKSDKDLLILFRALQQKAEMLVEDTRTELRMVAIRLTQFMSASGQLAGWRHVEEFITDQVTYCEKRRILIEKQNELKKNRLGRVIKLAPTQEPTTTNIGTCTVRLLQEDAETLLRGAFACVKWILNIEAKADETIKDAKTLERILGVLQHNGWMIDTQKFLENSEKQVFGLINNDPMAFAKFRELQSTGVLWPHSYAFFSIDLINHLLSYTDLVFVGKLNVQGLCIAR
jgi:hypothetical protein